MGSLLKEMAKAYRQSEREREVYMPQPAPERNFRPVSELQEEVKESRPAPKVWIPESEKKSWQEEAAEFLFTPARRANKQVKETKDFAKSVGKSVTSGASNLSTGMYNFGAKAGDIVLNPILATKDLVTTGKVKNEYNVLTNSDFIKNRNAYNDKFANDASTAMQKYGIAGTVADSLIRSATEMLPSVLGAMATGGGSVAIEATAKMNSIANALKIPKHMIASFISTTGNNYYQARKDGASDNAAALYALTSGYVNTLIESGGVQENIANGATKKAVKNWGEAFWDFTKNNVLSEGKEEVLQNISDKAIRKTVFDKDAPFVSMSDENAVINPKREAESFAVGSLAGGIFGGATGQFNMPKKKAKGEGVTVGDTAQTTPQSPIGDHGTPGCAPWVRRAFPTQGEGFGGQPMTNSEAEAIINDPTRRAEFEEKTGISLSGMTKAEQRAAVKGHQDKIDSKAQEVSKDTKLYNSSEIENKFDNESSIELEKDAEDYAYNEQTVLKDYIDSVNEDVLNGVREVRENTGTGFKRFSLGKVGEKALSRIKAITGKDMSGYTYAINSNGIRHINNRHGENGVHDNTMAKAEDIARVGYVLNNFDSMDILRDEKGNIVYSKEFKGKDNTPSPLYIYSKKINGTYYAAVATAENNYKKMWVVTSYISKNKEDITQVLHGEISALGYTSETVLPSLSSDDIIADNTPGVKGEVSTDFSAEQTTPQSATQTAPLAQGSQGASFEEEVTGGKFVLSDKVDLSHVVGKIDASDKRITDSIVLSHFLAERFGVVTRYIYDKNGRFCGKYDSGAIFINLAKIGNKSSFEVLAHEFGHAFSVINPTKYRELFVMVRNSTSLASRRYVDFRNNVYKKYKALGREYKQDEIDDVAFSELLSECFVETFKNPESLTKICEGDEKLHKNLREVILDLIDKVKKFFAGRKNENIRKIVDDFDVIERKIVEAVNESGYKESFESDGEVRYMFANDKDGNKYWMIEDDKDTFKGITNVKELKKAAYNYILNGEKGNKIVDLIDGKRLEFIRVSAREYVYGEASKTLSTEEYKQKMRMATSIIDLIENASIQYDAPDHKNHKLFPDGFKNYQGRVGIDETIFRYIVRVGKAKNGMIFYDINLEVDGKVPRANRTSLIKSSTPKNSIPNFDKKVKENLEDGSNGADYMPEGGYFDEEEVSGTSGTPSPTEKGTGGDYGWTDATKRNVKDINELVDMEGNVTDTSKIPTKRKLSNTKPKVLSEIDLKSEAKRS